jgi:hypothetical protein
MNTAVYNFTASGTHEYYADGYQVHNKQDGYCNVAGLNCGTVGTTNVTPPATNLCGQYTNNGPTCAAGATSSNSGVANGICPDGPLSTSGSLIHTWTCSLGATSQTCGGCEASGYGSSSSSSSGGGSGSHTPTWYTVSSNASGNATVAVNVTGTAGETCTSFKNRVNAAVTSLTGYTVVSTRSDWSQVGSITNACPMKYSNPVTFNYGAFSTTYQTNCLPDSVTPLSIPSGTTKTPVISCTDTNVSGGGSISTESVVMKVKY